MIELAYRTRSPLLRNCLPRVIAALIAVGVAAGGGIPPAAAEDTPPATITISGTIAYTGRSPAGGGSYASLPVRNAVVEVWDRNDSGADVRIATGHTFADGSYSLIVPTVETQSGVPGLIDPYVRVVAEGANGGSKVVDLVGSVYRVDSAVVTDLAADRTVNIAMGATDVAHQAFSVLDALTSTAAGYATLPGTTVSAVTAVYPEPGKISYYWPLPGGDGRLHVLAGDRYDWDVIAHEYAHFVQEQHPGLSKSPNGSHNLDDNLRYSRADLSAIEADRLAWGEGFSNWWSVDLQLDQGFAGLGIQNVGDFLYSDNKDADGVSPGTSLSLEDRSGGPSLGQDNEVSVARILHDLADSTNDAADRDRVSMGFTDLFALLVDKLTATLSDFWNALTGLPGTTTRQKIDEGAIFQAHNVSPVPLAPVYTAGSLIPRFSWSIPQGGVYPGYGQTLLNDFGVQFFAGDDMRTILSTSLLHDTTFWDPNPAEWEIISDTPGPVYWNVWGGTTVDSYSTGRYWSDVLAFRVPNPTTIWLVVQGLLLVALAAALRSNGSLLRQS